MLLFLGENAVIEYRWINNSVVDLYHTEVPPSHRGKGIAQLLAKVHFSCNSFLQCNAIIAFFIFNMQYQLSV